MTARGLPWGFAALAVAVAAVHGAATELRNTDGTAAVLELRQLQSAADTVFAAETTYIEAFETPRIEYTLNTFMREPGMLLELSRPAFMMGAISATVGSCVDETEELRQWLFTQAVGVSSRQGGSAITMLYAGMEDGRFIGCTRAAIHPHPPPAIRTRCAHFPSRFGLTRALPFSASDYHKEGIPDVNEYTFRGPGQSLASSTDLLWAPHANADAVPDTASTRLPTCDIHGFEATPSDASPACQAAGCTFGCIRQDGSCDSHHDGFSVDEWNSGGMDQSCQGRVPCAAEYTDRSRVCPTGCAHNFAGDCLGDYTGTGYTLSATCPGSRTATATDLGACTATATDGTAGCCDKNIRAYYSTSMSDSGVPQALTNWTTYDPRTRVRTQAIPTAT